MSDKLSVLVLNPFSSKIVDKKMNYDGLKKYGLNIHGGIKHFMRELGVGKTLQTDEEKIQKLLEGGEKSKIYKIVKSYCNKNNVVHVVYPLNYFELYFPFLENWNLNNKVFLHLVYGDPELDLSKIEKIEKLVLKNNHLVVASLSQEKCVFDENCDWRELQKWYDEIGFFQMQTSFSASEYMKKGIADGNKYIAPVSFIDSQAIEDGDVCFIGEIDQEKIAAVTKVFEVSKNEKKRSEFKNFDMIFITKQLPDLKLFVVKSPYSIYENQVLIEKDSVSTLPEKLSDNELRMVQFGDRCHLKLLNKYFNNEKGIIYDGHKKVRCEDKYNDEGNLAVSSNELILKRFSDEIGNFEVSLLSFEDVDFSTVGEYLNIINQNGIDVIIISVSENLVYSSLDFSKKNLNGEILNHIISGEFGV